jgi:hypothetical protein
MSLEARCCLEPILSSRPHRAGWSMIAGCLADCYLGVPRCELEGKSGAGMCLQRHRRGYEGLGARS